MAADHTPPDFVTRPVPSSYHRNVMAGGRDLKSHIDPSRSWWYNGALVVDGDGTALFDADGVRHPLPVPPWGGKLVLMDEIGAIGGPGGPGALTRLFIADEQDHVVMCLPNVGFSPGELRRFAAAAGLSFENAVLRLGQPRKIYPSLYKAPPNLEKAIHDQAQRDRSVRSRLHHLAHPGEPRPPTPPVLPIPEDVGSAGPGTSRGAGPAATGTAGDGAAAPLDAEAIMAKARATLAAIPGADRWPQPAIEPPAAYGELPLHAAVAHHAGDDVTYLVGMHDGRAECPPPAYAEALARARARPATEVREVDVCLQTGATATLRSRFAEAQRPLPPSTAQGKAYRIRTAFNFPDDTPQLVAAMDEYGADLHHADVTAPPGAPDLPAWWVDTVHAAPPPTREFLLIMAKANWANLFSTTGRRFTYISSTLI